MIFNFRIVSDEVDHFKREIQIDGAATFLDLKNAICDSVGYDKSQLCSFFLCSRGWEKEKEITLEDMGLDDDVDAYIMDECVLSDYIDDEGQRLLFTFDYMNDRSFFMEMKKMVTGRDLMDPVCTLSLGNAPQQIVEPEPMQVTIKPKKTAADIDAAAAAGAEPLPDDYEELTDEEAGFNPEEFDEEGFSELTFDE